MTDEHCHVIAASQNTEFGKDTIVMKRNKELKMITDEHCPVIATRNSKDTMMNGTFLIISIKGTEE